MASQTNNVYSQLSNPATAPSSMTEDERRSSVFYFLVMAQILVYAEAGAVPALLPRLTEAFELSFSMQGWLGGIVYIGISIGAPLASSFFQKVPSKRVLMGSLLTNAVFVLFFSLTPENWTYSLLGCRFMMGVTQSFLAIFTPVWVDVFATRSQQTQWFSWLQASTPVGIMFGYLLGYLADWLKSSNDNQECFGNSISCWRLPFVVQAILTVPLCVKLAFIARRNLNIGGIRRSTRSRGPSLGGNEYANAMENSETAITGEGLSRARADSAFLYGAQAAIERTWAQTFGAIWSIMTTLTFSCTVLCLSSLYFVVTSVQFWATDYLIKGPQKYPPQTVMLCFIATSATGPIFGVIFGGWTADKIGGYRGSPEQRFRCVSLVASFALVANVFAFSATYWPAGGMWFVMGCLWFLLYFGGACLPAMTGIFIDAVPTGDKALGSSMSQICFNFLGYFMSPVLSGELMARFSGEFAECTKYPVPGTCPEALEWGFRASLFGSAVALIFLVILWWHMLCQTSCWAISCQSGTADENQSLLRNSPSLIPRNISIKETPGDTD